MKISTGLSNAMLSSAPLRTALNGGEIRVYGGAVPADADSAIGGATLLGTYRAAGATITFAPASSNGTLTKNTSEVWGGTTVAAGTATFFRHVLPADDGTASTTALRIQGTCGLVGADMLMSSTTFTSGQTMQPLETYAIRLPLTY